MTQQDRRQRKFWGWGYEDETLPHEEIDFLRKSLAKRYKNDLPTPLSTPSLDEIELAPPRLMPSSKLESLISVNKNDRVRHCYGQSFPDIARAFLRQFPHPPDMVAWPETAQDVVRILDWADQHNVAVIPFGGGTSVCGGVEADVGDHYQAVVSLDMTRMDRVLEVDAQARAALIQAGAKGPDFDAALKPHGLTMRHFPQSYMMASLGGMIATRSGGHFATLYTHIDEFVEQVEMVAPSGIMQTRRLPASGAGPDPVRWICGSEGILGVITQAWVRLQNIPAHRSSAAVAFKDFYAGARATRAIAQSGLFPANCRLLDAREAASAGVGDGQFAFLILGFESADHPQQTKLARACELAADFGGQVSGAIKNTSASTKEQKVQRPDAAQAWRHAFLRMPYWREMMIAHGMITDTFETACLWGDFEDFHAGIVSDMQKVLRQATGDDHAYITCRFTHVYPDGPAPYFTFNAKSTPAQMLQAWKDIKRAANECVVRRGGTATHHHGVGRDHRPGAYDQERDPVFAEALAGAKARLDPKAIMNPGLLISPPHAPDHYGGILSS